MTPGFLFGSGRMETGKKKKSRLPRPQNATLHHWENKLSRPLSSHPPLPPSCRALQFICRKLPAAACQPAWCRAVPRARRLRRSSPGEKNTARSVPPNQARQSFHVCSLCFFGGGGKEFPLIVVSARKRKRAAVEKSFHLPTIPSLHPPPLPI